MIISTNQFWIHPSLSSRLRGSCSLGDPRLRIVESGHLSVGFAATSIHTILQFSVLMKDIIVSSTGTGQFSEIDPDGKIITRTIVTVVFLI